MIKIRKPKREEVGSRIVRTGEDGCEFVPYVKGYAVAQILDDSVGNACWQKRTEAVARTGENPFVITTISIYDKNRKEWIEKDGVGEAGELSADKSQETDSLKRAALSWGIGRELRAMSDRERLFIDASRIQIEVLKGFDGQPIYLPRARLSVADLSYGENGEVSYFAVRDSKGDVLYSLGQKAEEPAKASTKEAKDKEAKPRLAKPKEDKAVTEARKTLIDVGGKDLEGRKLSDASPQQMLWVFRHTRKAAVKNALVVIARADEAVKAAFEADGVKL